MRLFYALTVAGCATYLLLAARHLTALIPFRLIDHVLLDGMAKYQAVATLIGLLAAGLVWWRWPKSRVYGHAGDWNRPAEANRLFGIRADRTWRATSLQLLLVISLPTSLFMFLGVYHSDSLGYFEWSFLPFVLVFSATNALAEELIFRFVLVGGLDGVYPKRVILWISALCFGLPHYGGSPGGPVGVLMSGVLGYLLAKATMETKGLGVAWLIHFVQDLIIFSALMMMQAG